uniref:NADH dehydrogenase subunit 6 n=1 Tax=Entylia carinata TaxID=1464891 RepID=A0A343AXQ0_ENTCR|nr:NADH dehydrogenase subunit 6 [Entylia carinata]APU51898.1 NADH dehydrogenase subunit 6 [Entylia carinata]
MKTKILKTMVYLSMLSSMMKTPMSMMMLLLIQTMLSITLMNKMFNSSWFPMITFLMMIGGIMIIFMYMSSITSNKKFKTNMKIVLLSGMMLFMMEEMMSEFQMNENQELIKTMEDLSMTKMYNKTMFMTMLMVLYLLLTMLSINKIIKNFEGPLRSKTYE